ncbi:MAG: preprotein translocase subunit SecG, partial [Rickettsiales bacterium]|nr:preprotein translocase subunit SecG [Rickettsiales bacterium]
LLQRTDSDGMGGLGGGGGNQFLTGRAQANLMTRTTAILAGAFMVSSLILAVVANRMTSVSIVDDVAVEAPADVSKEATPVEKALEKSIDTPSAKPAEKSKAAPSVPKPE